MTSDLKLIQLSKKGSQSAFRRLVQRYEQRVRSTVVGMLGTVPEAEEVAQDVFIRFYKNLSQFKGEASLGTYLTRIAINLSLNALQARKKRRNRFSGMEVVEFNAAIKDNHNAETQLEINDLIEKGLERLDNDQRAIVVLRLIHGYSVKETAAMLDIPMGTVASRLSRAQVRLQEIIKALSK
jgi:RNA polymerase sigma-70 factor (ECF subfamily)